MCGTESTPEEVQHHPPESQSSVRRIKGPKWFLNVLAFPVIKLIEIPLRNQCSDPGQSHHPAFAVLSAMSFKQCVCILPKHAKRLQTKRNERYAGSSILPMVHTLLASFKCFGGCASLASLFSITVTINQEIPAASVQQVDY